MNCVASYIMHHVFRFHQVFLWSLFSHTCNIVRATTKHIQAFPRLLPWTPQQAVTHSRSTLTLSVPPTLSYACSTPASFGTWNHQHVQCGSPLAPRRSYLLNLLLLIIRLMGPQGSLKLIVEPRSKIRMRCVLVLPGWVLRTSRVKCGEQISFASSSRCCRYPSTRHACNTPAGC